MPVHTNMDSRGLNSGLLACITRTFLTKPSLQPIYFQMKSCWNAARFCFWGEGSSLITGCLSATRTESTEIPWPINYGPKYLLSTPAEKDCHAFQKQEGKGKNLRTRHRCIDHTHSYVLGPQSARLLIAAREPGHCRIQLKCQKTFSIKSHIVFSAWDATLSLSWLLSHLTHKRNHSQYIKTWTSLCSSKTILTKKVGNQILFSMSPVISGWWLLQIKIHTTKSIIADASGLTLSIPTTSFWVHSCTAEPSELKNTFPRLSWY